MSRWLFGESNRERRLRAASALAVAFGLLYVAVALVVDPLVNVQHAIADSMFQEEEGSPNVVVVAIDNDALDRFGRLGDWDRTNHATAIENLTAAGANVIAYDILFADPAPAGDVEGQENDRVLSEAIRDSGKVVLAAAANGAPKEVDGLLVYDSFDLPAPVFREGAQLASVNFTPDGDGRMRRVPLAVGVTEGTQLPSYSLAAVYAQFGRTPPETYDLSGDEVQLFGRDVPIDDEGTVRVNYVGDAGSSFPMLSFSQVFDNDAAIQIVEGKIVLIGTTATALDIHPAPLLGNAHGVVVHANAVDTMLRARFLVNVPDAVTGPLAALFVLVAGLAVARWRMLFGLVVVIAVISAYAAAGWILFDDGHIIDFADPPAALLVASFVAISYRAVSERTAQREMQDLFGRYVSPQVARELIERADRGRLALGGELREVTVMFGDIRGFTPLSTTMPADELVQLLNKHFEVIISRIMENRGIVNKFAGDAIMALWNAPEDQPGHASLACQAALEARDELEKLTGAEAVARWGFGVNTGVAVAGNVGSGRRHEYTVIGDPVNLASRICGIAPAGEVWIGESTFQQVRDEYHTDELPPQTVKGIDHTIQTYRVEHAGKTQSADKLGGQR